MRPPSVYSPPDGLMKPNADVYCKVFFTSQHFRLGGLRLESGGEMKVLHVYIHVTFDSRRTVGGGGALRSGPPPESTSSVPGRRPSGDPLITPPWSVGGRWPCQGQLRVGSDPRKADRSEPGRNETPDIMNTNAATDSRHRFHLMLCSRRVCVCECV